MTGWHDRYQEAMERVARAAGAWPHVAFWAVVVLVWASLGPLFGFSDSWQLAINTPTTIVELFLGLAVLVDGALITRLQFQQLEQIQHMVAALRESIDHVTEVVEEALLEMEHMADGGDDDHA